MHAVTARHFRSQKAILRDYARFRVKGESYPGIIPVTDAITEGILYFNVNEFSLEQLDIFEGDLYERIGVRVETEEKEMIPEPVVDIVQDEFPEYKAEIKEVLDSCPIHTHYEDSLDPTTWDTMQGFAKWRDKQLKLLK